VRFLALSALVFGLPPFHSAIRPLAPPERAQLTGEFWHAGCPVPLSSLSLLTVSHWDFAGNVQTGQLVVNRRAAAPLARVLRRLYGLRFPIRHMTFSDYYGPKVDRPVGQARAACCCSRTAVSPRMGLSLVEGGSQGARRRRFSARFTRCLSVRISAISGSRRPRRSFVGRARPFTLTRPLI
jgi:hypothetical protein